MSRQLICNFVRCQTINESLINVSNDFRLLRNNLRQTAFAFSIAQKVSIGQTNFSISKPFSLSPKRVRQYYPDFLALMEDGTYQLIEVKGDNMIDDAVVRAKKAAAEEMSVASGMRYLMYAGSLLMKTNVLEGSDFYQHSYTDDISLQNPD